MMSQFVCSDILALLVHCAVWDLNTARSIANGLKFPGAFCSEFACSLRVRVGLDIRIRLETGKRRKKVRTLNVGVLAQILNHCLNE